MNKHRHSMVRLPASQGGGADMEPDEDGAWVPNWYAGELEDNLQKSMEENALLRAAFKQRVHDEDAIKARLEKDRAKLWNAVRFLRDNTYTDADGPELRAQNERCHRMCAALLRELEEE